MPFFQNRSTLAYPATSTLPVQTWLDKRDPTSADFRNFEIGNVWVNEVALRIWFMVGRTVSSGTWVQGASTGTGILTVTGDVGGAVGPDGANNINLLSGSHLTVTGNPGANTLTITLDSDVASLYTADVGSAIPAAGNLNIFGAGGVSTSGVGNTITITAGVTVPTSFVTNAGTATPALNILDVFGTQGITTTGAGNTLTVVGTPAVAAGVSNLANLGTASFKNTDFSVDVNGFVSLSGTGAGKTITGNSGGALSPTAGNWNILATQVAQTGVPITTSGAGSTLTIQAQRATSTAATDVTKIGLAAFNSTQFTVDANGFVSINSATNLKVNNQIFTASGTYTPTVGMIYCIIQCIGGGGAGGGGAASSLTTISAGTGGTAGEYAQGVFTAAAIGVSKAVTIGAGGIGVSGTTGGNGGNTSVGVLISAFGGNGGNTCTTGSGATSTNSPAGGTGGAGGDFRSAGSIAQFANALSIGGSFALTLPTIGANSQFGAGGRIGINAAGSNATGYGAGGGGSGTGSAITAGFPGGNGSSGIVVITEFIVQ